MSDPRYAPSRFKPKGTLAGPRRYSETGASPEDLATRQRLFAEAEERMQYKHPVTVDDSRFVASVSANRNPEKPAGLENDRRGPSNQAPLARHTGASTRPLPREE